MTQDPPQPPPPPPGVSSGSTNKGVGCLYGGLAVVVSATGGSLVGGILSSMTPTSVGALVGIVSLLLPLALLIAAIVRWRKMPGFILGVGLSFAIAAVLLTACLAALSQIQL